MSSSSSWLRKCPSAPMLMLALCGGCGLSPAVSAAARDFQRTLAANAHLLADKPHSRHDAQPQPSERAARPLPQAEHSAQAHVEFALSNSPALLASFERWRAAVHRMAVRGKLAEPRLHLGYFLRPVETRVGPQRARLGLQQTFPWPGKLSASSNAAAAKARAAGRAFEAETLALRARVLIAHWNLHQLRRIRAIHEQHAEILRGLSETARARLATGQSSLADLQQIDLTNARLVDDIEGMKQREQILAARLRAEIGAPTNAALFTAGEEIRLRRATESLATLQQVIKEHPSIGAREALAEAQAQNARAAEADAFGQFSLSADWLLTDETPLPNVSDSGQDAIMIGAGLTIPLYQGRYAEAAKAARAEERAERARARSIEQQSLALLEGAYVAVHESLRKVQRYENTLIPQAMFAYESALGAYVTGRTNLAAMLLAQQDVLELRIVGERASAEHERSWARLESVVGRRISNATPTTERALPPEPKPPPQPASQSANEPPAFAEGSAESIASQTLAKQRIDAKPAAAARPGARRMTLHPNGALQRTQQRVFNGNAP